AQPDATTQLPAAPTRFDQTAHVVIPPRFDDAGPFSEGLAAVRVGGKFGYIDKTGRVVIEPQFDYAGTFSEGVASAGIGPKNGYIDKTGTFVITPQLMVVDLAAFSEGLAAVRVGEFLSGKWGFIDREGKLVIDPDFDTVGSFHEGLAVIGVDRR